MNRLKKGLLSLVMVLVLAGLLGGGARATESTEDMVARVKRGVVQLYTVEYRNGRPTGYGCSGTGFAVGTAGEDSDVFVTNWHVVTSSGNFDPNQARVYIALENASFEDAIYERDRVIPCELLYTPQSGNPDMAIIRAAEPVTGFKALPLLSSDKIRDAAHVVALGYPGVLDDISATSGGVDDMSVTQGYVVRHSVGTQEIADFAGTKLVIFDALISHGNSGGALVNDAGAVVGINTYGFEDFSAAVYIDYAMEALDGLNIPYDVYDPAAGQESPTPAPAPEQEPSPGTEPSGEPSPGTEGDSNQEPDPDGEDGEKSLSPIVFVGVGAAVLAVVVLIVVLLRKPSAKTQASPQNREAAAPGFVLLGPGGLRAPVTASGLIIGRDPGLCTLCLPAETKGVSRRHCQVTIAGGSLLLTDLGSSYGTFASGQKLEPNRPVYLSRGSSFYLCDTSIMFTVQ